MRITPKPWPKFRAELLSLYVPPLRAKATRAAMVTTLDRLESLGVQSTRDLTVPLVARLVTSFPPEMAPRTIQGYLRRVRVVCNYGVNSACLNVSPFQARPVRSWVRLGSPRVKPHQSREEIRRVLDLMAADVASKQGWALWRARRLYALSTLFAFTGLRRNEGLFLHVEDLDLDRRVVWVRDRGHLKCDSAAQPVPLPAAAVAPLRDWLVHRLDRPPGFRIPAEVPFLFPNVRLSNAWSDGTRGQRPIDRLQAVGKRAGVQGLTWHSLRRSLATHLEGAGLGQALITRILRHTSERTSQMWYQDSDVPNLTRATEAFDF